ncbi:WecB/TagA/CpsF family glycosyltransferase [Kaistia dalseonensis]|uniref:Exopolysaccharide biosynthesis WecB/TagA/CpsF family protein n=1 Tax=Kaistia dalseonensis TaxID=410840 RepID=A0ABU0H9N7_9HYPH|nr:WecB/TagA/CpsF family glycosyltransferase [Kaistia dalseonensis]MCX5495980.1 WecB/TagA/CpsF family glycosyltransferase [Kaistia dalseonensis]MDQ0438583.1 exopolysaccharide biosynthesis WecB/TagA/CpsF family protein [Kaistia dalseonensis]
MAEGRLNIRDQDELVSHVVDDALAGRGGTVFTLNLDHLVKLRDEPRFRAAYQRASYVSADGAPVVTMAKGLGEPVDRVTGADLVLPLSRAAAASGVPIYLFGTADAVRDKAAARLMKEIPGLAIAGSESPPFGFDPEGEAARVAAERIAASGARICFVALGAPKQEYFANLAVCRVPGVMFICVGAALDFIAGETRRAPVVWQKAGFEWAWRLLQEPRRLVRRYTRSLLYFFNYRLRGADDRMLRVDRRRNGDGRQTGWFA